MERVVYERARETFAVDSAWAWECSVKCTFAVTSSRYTTTSNKCKLFAAMPGKISMVHH